MPCEQLLADLRADYPLFLVAVTISIEDYLRHYNGQSEEQIRAAADLRKGDLSKGSTYLLDLENGHSYRFMNHHAWQGKTTFKGFVPDKQRNKIAHDLSLHTLKSYARDYPIISF